MPTWSKPQCSPSDFCAKDARYTHRSRVRSKLLFKLLEAWKLSCDRETRGIKVVDAMSEEERIQALSGHLAAACCPVGNWEELSAEQQSTVTHNAWLALALTTGERAFEALSEDEKSDALFIVWSGCCMHKELNAVKGGATAMAAAWIDHKLTPPTLLRNKFELEKDIDAPQ
jgi:hypothetical protein